jgi:ELWxxDGT repeat protein
LQSIEEALDGKKAASIAIASHLSTEGSLDLGDGITASADSISQDSGMQEFWLGLAGLVDSGGSLDLLACDLTGSEPGLELVESLEELTGLEVNASDDPTGSPEAGGDWVLEDDNVDLTVRYFDPTPLAQFKAVLASTTQVADLNPGGSDDPRNLTMVDGTLYFTAFVGGETWLYTYNRTTDTTPNQVRQLTGAGGLDLSNLDNFTASGDKLFFTAEDATGDNELYVSDGTSAGTHIVTDLNDTGDADPDNLIDLDGTLLFTATDGTNGVELYKTDGTPGGTSQVEDFNGGGDSNPNMLTYVDGEVFFTATDGTKDWLCKSDGDAPITKVMDLTGSGWSNLDNFTAVDDELFFTAEQGGDVELYISSPYEGTKLLENINAAASSNPTNLTEVDRELFFTANDGTSDILYNYDGIDLNVVKNLTDEGWTGLDNFTKVSNKLYFTADDGTGDVELYVSNGTDAGTMQVKDINTSGSSDPDNLTDDGGTLYFAADDGEHGRELWKSGGDADSTTLVADIWDGPTGSDPNSLVNGNLGLHGGQAGRG